LISRLCIESGIPDNYSAS